MSDKKEVKTMNADELMNILLEDFKGVLEEINNLIVEKDIDGVRKVLENVGIIIAEKEGIPLNSIEDEYDNVLQELLAQLDGVIEKTEVVKGIDSEPGKRYLTNEEVDNRIKELEERREQVAGNLKDLKRDDPEEQEVSARLISERMKLTEEISALETSKTTDSDLSTYTIIDENLKALQDERKELVDEKARNLEEIERLQPQAKGEPEPEIVPFQQIDQDRANELDQLISELNQKVNEIGQKNINDLISELRYEARANSEEFSKLQQTIESLEHDREQAEYTRDNEKGDIVKEAIADLEKINDELAKKQKQLEDLDDSLDNDNPNKDSIELLEEFVSNGSVTFSDVVSQLQNEKTKLQQAIEGLEHDREQAEYTRDNEKGDIVKEAIADLEKINNELTEKQKQLNEVNDKIRKIAFPEYVELAFQLNQAKRERGDLQKDGTIFDQLPDKSLQKDNSERIEELQKRNDEIDQRIAEIDKQIGDIPGTTPDTTKTEVYDVKEEAQRIGKALFLEREIREEINNRFQENGLTREQYLEFYTAGKENCEQKLENVRELIKTINADIFKVTVDFGSEKDMITQIEKANQSGDEQKIIETYEKLRKKFYGNEDAKDELSVQRREELKNGGLDHEITTIEDANKMDEIFNNFIESRKIIANELAKQQADLEDSVTCLDHEIETIKREIATIKLIGESEQAYMDSINKSIEIREKLLRVSMVDPKKQTEADKEILQQFNTSRDRFLSHKTTGSFTYVDKDGKTQTLDKIQTIDMDYPEYKEDLEWLSVHEFKGNLEQIDAFEKTGDPYIFGEEVGQEYMRLKMLDNGSEKAYIDKIYGDKKEYIETFNGIPNYYKLRYENFKTAGSTLKQMKPISKDLPPAVRAKNGLENVGRFFGIRVPKFTKVDAQGNEVRDVKSGLATLAIDAAVVGAVVGSAVAIGPGLAVAGYAAKGIVIGGNKIAARRVYKRHKDEIDNNIPTLGNENANRDAREVARKEYYREHGNNRFVAWAKAKSDKYFTRKRGQETENAIVTAKQEEYKSKVMERSKKVLSDYTTSNKNQDARNDRTLQSSLGAFSYNQMKQMIEAGLKDGKSEEDIINEVVGKAIKVNSVNGALNAKKLGLGKERIYGQSNPLDEQFVKDEEKEYAKTEKLTGEALKGRVVGEVSSISASQQAKGLQQRLDRYNKLWTALLTMGIKMGITAAKDGFTKEVTDTIEHDAEYETKEVPIENQVEQPIYEEQTVTKIDADTLGDMKANSTGGVKEVYSGTAQASDKIANDDIAAIAAEYVDENGNKYVMSLAESGGNYSTTHVHSLVSNVNLEDCSPSEIIDLFKEYDETNYNAIVEAMGLTDGTNEEIFTKLVEEGVINIQSSAKEGWREILKDNLTTSTELVQTGTETVTETTYETVTELVKEAYTETITSEVFSPKKAITELVKATLVGLGFGHINDAHETAQPTYKRRRGTPEQAMPEAFDKKEVETEEDLETIKKGSYDENYVENLTSRGQDMVNAKRKAMQAEEERKIKEEEKANEKPKEKAKKKLKEIKEKIYEKIDDFVIDGEYEDLDDDDDLDFDDDPDLDDDDDRDL